MKEIKTKFGVAYIKPLHNGLYDILDSEKRILFFDCSKEEKNDFVKGMLEAENVKDWLEQFEDVCWGTKQDIMNFTNIYHKSNGRLIDKKWLEENYNRMGDTYILFEYSDCYL